MKTAAHSRGHRSKSRRLPQDPAVPDLDLEIARVDAQLSSLALRLEDVEDEVQATADRLSRLVATLRRRRAHGGRHA